jgi:predicted nucleic acid-binding protein
VSLFSDADDDMFLACALAAKTRVVCSGDKALLILDGHETPYAADEETTGAMSCRAGAAI